LEAYKTQDATRDFKLNQTREKNMHEMIAYFHGSPNSLICKC